MSIVLLLNNNPSLSWVILWSCKSSAHWLQGECQWAYLSCMWKCSTAWKVAKTSFTRPPTIWHKEESPTTLPLRRNPTKKIDKMCKHVVKVNSNGTVMKFSVGVCCIVAGGPEFSEEWYMKLTNIILISAFHDKYHIFIDGIYFIPAFNNGRVVNQTWTETVQLVSHQYGRDIVQFATHWKRKCILYPKPAFKDNQTFCLLMALSKSSSGPCISGTKWRF